MCVESLDPGSGKSSIASDRSIEAYEALISKLNASIAVLEARLKVVVEDKEAAERARDFFEVQGRDLQSQLDAERKKNHDQL